MSFYLFFAILQIRGKFDIRNIGLSPRSIDIDGSVRPRYV